MAKLSDIEGIGETYANKLKNAGIGSTQALLDSGSSKKGRKKIAADLSRIKGVSTQYADLLEAAGVDTVPELAQRNAENLQAKMVEVNADKHLVRQVPGATTVMDWVAQAKALPRVITH